MDTHTNANAEYSSQGSSIGGTVREILQESRKRRVVIRKRSGEKVFECSLLLAVILSIGAPALPAIVILGVLVESIKVSLERV